jgi:hypothetical protein
VTLADVFSTLTGRPAAAAYKELTDLLQAHLPMGPKFTAARDNLFPLRDTKRRSVGFTASEVELNAVRDPEGLLASLKAGPMCPRNAYTYHNVNVSSALTLSGRTLGFAQPVFQWTINGVALNAVDGAQYVNVSMTATDTVPGRGEPPVVVNLKLKCLVVSIGLVSTLIVFNLTFPGNGVLTISLSAAEALLAGDVPTPFSDEATILTRRYAMAGAWGRDVAACNIKDLGLIVETVKTLAHRLVEDENRPNPNPTLVRALSVAAKAYVDALDVMTGGSRGLERDVVGIFEQSDVVRAPLEPYTFRDSRTGLRILRHLPHAPAQLPPDGKPEDTTDGNARSS